MVSLDLKKTILELESPSRITIRSSKLILEFLLIFTELILESVLVLLDLKNGYWNQYRSISRTNTGIGNQY